MAPSPESRITGDLSISVAMMSMPATRYIPSLSNWIYPLIGAAGRNRPPVINGFDDIKCRTKRHGQCQNDERGRHGPYNKRDFLRKMRDPHNTCVKCRAGTMLANRAINFSSKVITDIGNRGESECPVNQPEQDFLDAQNSENRTRRPTD